MQDAVAAMVDHLDAFPRMFQSACGGGVVQGVPAQDAVQLENCFRRQGIADVLGDRTHGLEVAKNHLLALALRPSPLA